MDFKSTRDENNIVSPSMAILQGLAEDGGLFVPVSFPRLGKDLETLGKMSYQELAFEIMSAYLHDFSDEDLWACINGAYDEKFDDPGMAPVVSVGNVDHMELFHGSTIAFKDMALSILPYLMKTSAVMNKSDKDIVILTATSGDTGKAAMAGFADVPGTSIIVFYPKNGVSSIQERQMVTQKGDNTHVVAIEGNFDSAQTKVKELFNDNELRNEMERNGFQFSSANSMNIGRLLPQVVYYAWAYLREVETGRIEAGKSLNFCVPTGNFGDILAGYYAKMMGVPIGKLICASNDNKVLYDFFETGTYDRNREFVLTISPSMDILISSNFERMLYHATGNNTGELLRLMGSLESTGIYTVGPEIMANFGDFAAEYANEAETMDQIRKVFEETGYVMDPHTAVASRSYEKYVEKTGDNTPCVIVSTASPYKFPEAVLNALGSLPEDITDDSLIDTLNAVSKVAIPKAIHELKDAPVRHGTVVPVDGMKDIVRKIILK
ncbi:threonine synthase [Youngiibacter fragilis]|uniref:Threonine synthase n=1 Tax=Youngiibacter fragilis 232.1 TaxID=994573 RepID=V7I6K2_9CLOT|nr:threonine synthase [Youngiibacter fragilis]ETA80926.1 threonine synthase [Youngiibacter fragilis 232.1]